MKRRVSGSRSKTLAEAQIRGKVAKAAKKRGTVCARVPYLLGTLYIIDTNTSSQSGLLPFIAQTVAIALAIVALVILFWALTFGLKSKVVVPSLDLEGEGAGLPRDVPSEQLYVDILSESAGEAYAEEPYAESVASKDQASTEMPPLPSTGQRS